MLTSDWRTVKAEVWSGSLERENIQHPTNAQLAATAGISTPRSCKPGIASAVLGCHVCALTTVAEIQEAIERLSAKEKAALAVWLESQEEPAMSEREKAALLASLKKAECGLDLGRGVPIEEVRTRVAKWAAR
jgi:hypothetical protein